MALPAVAATRRRSGVPNQGDLAATSALYCHPVAATEWPSEPQVVERVPLRACARRGAAIDVIAERSREHRSQIVFTTARGREMVFWQSRRTRRQARPNVRLPTARAAEIAELGSWSTPTSSTRTTSPRSRSAPCAAGCPAGDYAVTAGGRLIAAVERKSLAEVSSLVSGRLRFALGELATLRRAAIVVEDRYSKVSSLDRVRPAVVADGLAELRAWARANGLAVPDRGRLRPEVHRAWQEAHRPLR